MLLFYGSLRGAFFVSWGGTASFFLQKKIVQTRGKPQKFLLKGIFSCGIIRVVETNVIRTFYEVYYDEKGLPFAVCYSIKLGLFG